VAVVTSGDPIRPIQAGTEPTATVLETALCGIDIYGHNGISVADIDNDGFDDLLFASPPGCRIVFIAIAAMEHSKTYGSLDLEFLKIQHALCSLTRNQGSRM